MAGNALGIDVSNFDGQFDWAATSGLSFGICRASQGLGAAGTNSPDPFLSWNWPRIKAKGLARGAYHFLDPGLDGAAQASYFVSRSARSASRRPTCSGWTTRPRDRRRPPWPPAPATSWPRLVSLRPHNPCGVYSFFDFITSGNCAGLGSYPLWLAIFQSATPTAPAPWQEWKIWQSGGTSSHDNDVFNGIAAELTAWISSFQEGGRSAVRSAQHRRQRRYGDHGAARQRHQHRVRLRQRGPGTAARRAPGRDPRHQGWHITNTSPWTPPRARPCSSSPIRASTGVISVRAGRRRGRRGLRSLLAWPC